MSKSLILFFLILPACHPIDIKCAKPPRPDCAPVVKEYQSMIAQTPPVLKEPSPHDLLDILECVEMWESS